MKKDVRSKSLGNLVRWEPTSNGLEGETTCGRFKVEFFNESIVRIAATQDEAFENFSYAVITGPGPLNNVHLNDSGDHFFISTEKVRVKIEKYPVRFHFLTPDNRILNEDDVFGISWNGEQVTTYKKLQPGERFIGLGEKTGGLDRKGSGYQNWNTDSFSYALSADPLYCSIPFYIGIHNQLTYGIFFDNSHKSFFNFGASNDRFSSFSSDAGDMNYYFIAGDSVGEIIRQYTHLTGRTELPPLWSIGYQQCRYSYYPDKEVLSLAQTFRDKDIPCDVIVLDIHYMQDYKIFTWSGKNFPDPKAMIEKLKANGFQVVVICDPGIKIENGYFCYEEGVREEVFLKYPDGTFYTGNVWPGWCHFPDFTNPKTRDWWKRQFTVYVSLGIAGFWNDMNEIATWGNMIPENIEFDFEGTGGTMRAGHNVYGFQMARSTYEGAKALLQGQRPFNLTRSGYAGVQRFGAVWTGDNVSYDEHMILGVRMVNSMGLSGIPFAGYDVGGFVGEGNAKLFARWVSIGAFSPLFRGHTMINSSDSEPWSYGEEAEQIARNYIRFRYQLMPYIYSLFCEASQTGMPVQRSLAIDHPHDPKIYDGQFYNEYLFGPYVLVCPVESHKNFLKVYFPGYELWYSLYDGKKYVGHSESIVECPLYRLPVFVKEGAIIPMQAAGQNTTEKGDELILHIYTGSNSSSFVFYDDDGTTLNYEKGQFHKRRIDYVALEKKVIIGKAEGDYQPSFKKLKIVFHGLERTLTNISVNGDNEVLHPNVNHFFGALEKHDPFYDPEPAPEEPVHTIGLNYTWEELTLIY